MDKHCEQVSRIYQGFLEQEGDVTAAAGLTIAAQIAQLNETWENVGEMTGERLCDLANTIEKHLREIDKTLMKELR